jgi:PAS domain S-box-containing protein
MNPLATATDNVSSVGSRAWDYRAAAGALVYVALYVLLDWFSYVQPVLKLGITPWNPQAGLTLAFLLMYGPRWAPVTAGAALLSEVLVRESSPVVPLVLGASLWIALGYGVLAGLLRRWHLDEPIRTLGMAARFAGAAVGTTLVLAGGYVVLFVISGELPLTDAIESLPRLWIGDLTGILTLTPLLIWAERWRGAVQAIRRHRWEVLAQFVALSATLWILFAVLNDQLRFFYPLFVPVIWVALRWGASGAMLPALATQIGLVIAAQQTSLGPPPLIDLQFFMLTLSLTALLLGAVVTERADALRRVAMREVEQRALLAMAPDGVLAVDSSGQVLMANPAALRLFGEAASVQRAAHLSDLIPGLRPQTSEGRATLEGRRADGVTFPAEIAWARLDAPANEGLLLTVRDATERRRAETQLRERDRALARAMRFAVAGELASALAHELNQPITALVSYLRAAEILAAPFEHEEERLTATLGKAAREAIRASEVLRRLRDFYRGGTIKSEDVQIATLCHAVGNGFQDRLKRAGTPLVMQVDSSLPTVRADATQLEIVLHNLVSNAIDAVNQVDRARRCIELEATRVDGHIVVRVEDSGPGIAPEVAQKLFEPFVTSKPDGMGLGLALSRSLVRARGGELTFEPSEKLGGASFVVRLPVEYPADESS